MSPPEDTCYIPVVDPSRTSSDPLFRIQRDLVVGSVTMRLQSLTLYQPEGLVQARMPGGTDALGSFIKALHAGVEAYFEQRECEPTGRALVVALTPSSSGCWLLSPSGDHPESDALGKTLSGIEQPEVVDGPVAFALMLNAGAEYPEGTMPLPGAWSAVVEAAGETLAVDDIIDALLPPLARVLH